MGSLTALNGGRRVPIEQRVASLEERMERVEGGLAATADAAHTAAQAASRAADAVEVLAGEVGQVLDVVKGAKTIGGFCMKHYPRLIAFGTGLAAAAGWGNPKVVAFISHFFGV